MFTKNDINTRVTRSGKRYTKPTPTKTTKTPKNSPNKTNPKSTTKTPKPTPTKTTNTHLLLTGEEIEIWGESSNKYEPARVIEHFTSYSDQNVVKYLIEFKNPSLSNKWMDLSKFSWRMPLVNNNITRELTTTIEQARKTLSLTWNIYEMLDELDSVSDYYGYITRDNYYYVMQQMVSFDDDLVSISQWKCTEQYRLLDLLYETYESQDLIPSHRGYISYIGLGTALTMLSNEDKNTRVQAAFYLFDWDGYGMNHPQVKEYLCLVYALLYKLDPEIQGKFGVDHLTLAEVTADQIFSDLGQEYISLDQFKLWYQGEDFITTPSNENDDPTHHNYNEPKHDNDDEPTHHNEEDQTSTMSDDPCRDDSPSNFIRDLDEAGLRKLVAAQEREAQKLRDRLAGLEETGEVFLERKRGKDKPISHGYNLRPRC
tara:strand:- start:11712 stop:12995 length:1284 start_codon:yes stop_codon:yes gene_type:complete